MEPVAADTRALPKTRTSSKGSFAANSYRIKIANNAAVSANETSVIALSQPRCGPSITVNTNSPTMAIDKMNPGTSSPRGLGSFDEGMRIAPSISAITPTGKLMRNTEPQ